MLGKMPVEIEGTANIMQNLTSLDHRIPPAQRYTLIGVQDQEAKFGHVLDHAKQLLSISVDGDVHGSIFRGQRWPRQVLARLEDLVLELDELRSVLYAHKMTLCNIRLPEVFLS